MLVHDIIKIKYVKLGYLKKNYPYHLISDEEMFNAFIDLGNGFTSGLVDPDVKFFDTYYPNPFAEQHYIYKDTSLSEKYSELKQYIINTINNYLANEVKIPDWIYTYMLGEVIYNQSDYLDIQDCLTLLHCSNLNNEFTPEACAVCYQTSLNYISTLTSGVRPPTVFGEPHVIKNLRLEA